VTFNTIAAIGLPVFALMFMVNCFRAVRYYFDGKHGFSKERISELKALGVWRKEYGYTYKRYAAFAGFAFFMQIVCFALSKV
jgi:hypothetical protein